MKRLKIKEPDMAQATFVIKGKTPLIQSRFFQKQILSNNKRGK
tara:strand:+ start:204 stop:332 length:129 start_codon:yes stop_codon:yes gene_type:complete